MQSIHEAPVFRHTYDILKEIHTARGNFAKTEKYSLGEAMENAALALLLNIIDAGRAKRQWKVAPLDAAIADLDKLKVLVRLAYDIEQIDQRRMTAWQESLRTIGRQLGGWRKSL